MPAGSVVVHERWPLPSSFSWTSVPKIPAGSGLKTPKFRLSGASNPSRGPPPSFTPATTFPAASVPIVPTPPAFSGSSRSPAMIW